MLLTELLNIAGKSLKKPTNVKKIYKTFFDNKVRGNESLEVKLKRLDAWARAIVKSNQRET